MALDGAAGRSEFVCHKTAIIRRGMYVAGRDSQHCAGALIFAEKQEAPTQMMRIMERLHLYDRRKLDMTANVFGCLREMIDAAFGGG